MRRSVPPVRGERWDISASLLSPTGLSQATYFWQILKVFKSSCTGASSAVTSRALPSEDYGLHVSRLKKSIKSFGVPRSLVAFSPVPPHAASASCVNRRRSFSLSETLARAMAIIAPDSACRNTASESHGIAPRRRRRIVHAGPEWLVLWLGAASCAHIHPEPPSPPPTGKLLPATWFGFGLGLGLANKRWYMAA